MQRLRLAYVHEPILPDPRLDGWVEDVKIAKLMPLGVAMARVLVEIWHRSFWLTRHDRFIAGRATGVKYLDEWASARKSGRRSVGMSKRLIQPI